MTPHHDPAAIETKLNLRRIEAVTGEILAHLRALGIETVPTTHWTQKLPPKLRGALFDHCVRTGERPADVLIDAIALHLDALAQTCPCEATCAACAGQAP